MDQYSKVVRRLEAIEQGKSYYAPVAGEPSGGTWHKVADPSTGYFASKTAGWTADSFSGGLEVDFSAVVPAGTKAVRVTVVCNHLTALGSVFYRKSGDTNISNTPLASEENSHRLLTSESNGWSSAQAVIWLSSDYKAQFAVVHVDYDLWIAYPTEYLL